ncbi:hypothetical protein [Aestuariimicrobium ganziense]|uniref:hypothetical protein n=1 Tax=Aestuariimicrobium ganziense TaxID=2773677 RepID=UPI00194127E2|nr:hypothetical protein [Aestuariimicrobium ganziense]
MVTILHRHSVKPGHLDPWRALFVREVELRRRHGFTTLRAYLQEQDEPKLSWLYSHDDPDEGRRSLNADPEHQALRHDLAEHVFTNDLVRPVDLVHDALTSTDRLVVVRRYSIVGGWDEFLALWRPIADLRERHGFRVLFAAVDRERDLFTWAFDTDGTWDELPDRQRAYYDDPDRIALRGVFNHMADYTIDPARQLL